MLSRYQEKFNLIKSLLNKNNPIIIEIGAHYGEDTLRFLETFPHAKIHGLLRNINKINYFWKSTDILETARIHDNIEYAKTINSSNIWIATQAAFGDITPRYFEILGSGTLLFCEKNDGRYRSIFKNRTNCIEFKSDLSDFLSLLNDLVENEQEIRNISSNGYSDAQQFHTWDVRAKELISIFEGLI